MKILQKEIDRRIQKLLQERSITLAFNSIIKECNKRQAALFERVLDRDEYNRKKREYWASRSNHLNEKRRENYQKEKAHILAKQAVYRQKNPILRQLNNFRTQQKELAMKMWDEGYFDRLVMELSPKVSNQ